MAQIHYFQRYSQPENVATNNTLSLFSRLYHTRPGLLENVLNALIAPDDEQRRLRIGVDMEQQKRKGGNTIPDGFIEQMGFRLLIETKRGKDFRLDQLEGHSVQFEGTGRKILLLLGRERLNPHDLARIGKIIGTLDGSVDVIDTTFDDIVRAVRAELSIWQEDLHALIEDYAQFCTQEDLLNDSWYWMRMVLSGKTIEHNKSHRLYYDLASHGYSAHDYIGLYTGKAIQAIGKVENILTVDIVDGKASGVSEDLPGKPATREQLHLIEDVVKYAWDGPGYNIRKGHRFFIVEEFVDTLFKKTSPNAPMGKRFFDLRQYIPPLREGVMPPIKDIAEALKNGIWE